MGDVAAIASRSALDGSAKRTRLYLDGDGMMQLVDLDRGNRPEDARIVGLRTLYSAVKTDSDRSLIRREMLMQCSSRAIGDRAVSSAKATLKDIIRGRHILLPASVVAPAVFAK